MDASAAEGNFSLSIVEKVKKLYIFECSEGWIGPLQKTFEPWREKVEIIPLKLSKNVTSESTTLDQFFAEKNELPTILKIDVDGGEQDLLKGASRVLQQSDKLKISLCTYHQKNDFREFKTLLEKLEFKVHSSKGYMIFYLDEPLKEPYLRKHCYLHPNKKMKSIIKRFSLPLSSNFFTTFGGSPKIHGHATNSWVMKSCNVHLIYKYTRN